MHGYVRWGSAIAGFVLFIALASMFHEPEWLWPSAKERREILGGIIYPPRHLSGAVDASEILLDADEEKVLNATLAAFVRCGGRLGAYEQDRAFMQFQEADLNAYWMAFNQRMSQIAMRNSGPAVRAAQLCQKLKLCTHGLPFFIARPDGRFDPRDRQTYIAADRLDRLRRGAIVYACEQGRLFKRHVIS